MLPGYLIPAPRPQQTQNLVDGSSFFRFVAPLGVTLNATKVLGILVGFAAHRNRFGDFCQTDMAGNVAGFGR